MTQPVRGPRSVANFDEVIRWMASLAHITDPERNAMLAELERFCAFARCDPHQLVQGCFRKTTSGETAISAKGRRELDSTIDEFAEAEVGPGHAAIVMGNHIRSFLIYNGVFMQGRASFR